MAKKICPIHGIIDGECAKCKSKSNKMYDRYKRDKELDSFYKSSAWRKLRTRFIKANPLCNICGYPAKIVDHIIEIRDGGAKLDSANLQSLCQTCHNRKTIRERIKRGGGQKSLKTDTKISVRPPKFSQTPRDGGTP